MKTLLHLIREDAALSRPCIAARRKYRQPEGLEWWRPVAGVIVWLVLLGAAVILLA